jgi:hypothetical protein
VTEALGGQPPEYYERDLPQMAVAATARQVQADVVVLLLDDGDGQMAVSSEVGLARLEREVRVGYDRAVMRELFHAGVGVIERTDRVRAALEGIPGSRAQSMAMVPLTQGDYAFGALIAGRNPRGGDARPFADTEVRALLRFAESAAPALRAAVLLRHLKDRITTPTQD